MRPTARERGYTRKWQSARESYLQDHPLCVECLADEVVTVATEVDHITPHRGDQTLFWDRNNWQALCKPCHSRKTVRTDGGFGNPRAH